jgi:hypothetical protein
MARSSGPAMAPVADCDRSRGAGEPALSRALEEGLTRAKGMERELKDTRRQLAQARAEIDTLKSCSPFSNAGKVIEALTEELTVSREELEKTRKMLEAMRAECKRLRRRNGKLTELVKRLYQMERDEDLQEKRDSHRNEDLPEKRHSHVNYAKSSSPLLPLARDRPAGALNQPTSLEKKPVRRSTMSGWVNSKMAPGDLTPPSPPEKKKQPSLPNTKNTVKEAAAAGTRLKRSRTEAPRPSKDVRVKHVGIFQARSQPGAPPSSYKYAEVVRGKRRAGMTGHDCPDCSAFHDVMEEQGIVTDRQAALDACSRHRLKRGYQQEHTPENFWRLSFLDEEPTHREVYRTKKSAANVKAAQSSSTAAKEKNIDIF